MAALLLSACGEIGRGGNGGGGNSGVTNDARPAYRYGFGHGQSAPTGSQVGRNGTQSGQQIYLTGKFSENGIAA